MVLAIALVLLVVGSVLFHFLSPWYFTPIASNWGAIDDTVSITFWVTGFVFVAVNLFMAYCVMRYRHQKGSRAHYEPENKKLEGVAGRIDHGGNHRACWPPACWYGRNSSMSRKTRRCSRPWASSGTGAFASRGRTACWAPSMPASSATRTRLASIRTIPYGRDDILIASPELHLPIGKPVKALLRSIDVLHDFAVPQFRVKMDLVPGLVTYVWFTPTRTGKFDLLCEELCGIAHFAMRGKVVVEEERAFQAWSSSYPTFAQSMAQVSRRCWQRARRSMRCVLPVMARRRRATLR